MSYNRSFKNKAINFTPIPPVQGAILQFAFLIRPLQFSMLFPCEANGNFPECSLCRNFGRLRQNTTFQKPVEDAQLNIK